MMRIIPRGPDAYLFRDGSHTPVGWLKARTVRFTRFATRRDAVAAGVQGGLALATHAAHAAHAGGATPRVSHAGPGVARPPNDEDGTDRRRDERPGVRVVHDGRYEWVGIDAVRVARLVPPAEVEAVPSIEEVMACGGPRPRERTPEASAYSLEFPLPAEASLDACLTIVQLLHAAVRHHRMPPARPTAGERPDDAGARAATGAWT